MFLKAKGTVTKLRHRCIVKKKSSYYEEKTYFLGQYITSKEVNYSKFNYINKIAWWTWNQNMYVEFLEYCIFSH